MYCSYTLHNCFILKLKINPIRFHSLSFFVLLVFIRCHSLSLVVPLVVTRCHSLCHSLSSVFTLRHSLSLVVTLVVTRCHSLSLVLTQCTTRLSFYKRSFVSIFTRTFPFSHQIHLLYIQKSRM